MSNLVKHLKMNISVSEYHEAQVNIHAYQRFFKLFQFVNNTVIRQGFSVDNIELMFMDFSVGMFQILCFVQYILGVWKIPCVQFPQRSQAALPDNIRVASTDGSALCHEQWVFINTGSSDGECDESLRLSNVDQCCLMQTLQLLCRRNLLTVTSYAWILSCYCFNFSVETPFWPSWFRSSHWHSVASWWPKGHYGPQYRYFMEAVYCSLKSVVCFIFYFNLDKDILF